MHRLILTTVMVLAGLVGCAKTNPSPADVTNAALGHAAGGQRVPDTEPAVEMWNGGIYLAGIKPFLLFAAWDDGTVLVRGPAPSRIDAWSHEPLYRAEAAPADIDRLRRTCEQAGFFHSPLDAAGIVVDGPEFIMIVRDAQRVGTLRYRGGDPKLDEIGPTATPSRVQMEAFYKLWSASEAAIKNVPVKDAAPYDGPLPNPPR